MARDSEGRVREEEQQTNKPTYFVVLDPVGHVQLRWSSATKTATRFGFAGEREQVTFPLQPWLAILKGRGWEQPDSEGEPEKVTTEDLGQKTINGLVTTGTRTSTVIPIGKLGNDRAVTVVHDVWFSQDLKLAVLDTVDDPIGPLLGGGIVGTGPLPPKQ
jgi:hypothetical protein